MQGVIFISGNDGTGKTSVSLKLNNITSKYLTIERSSVDINSPLKNIIDQIDKMTLKYSYDKYNELPKTVVYDNNVYPLYWFILDAPVSIIENRIKTRNEKTIWETLKSLEYFRERFRELSAYYGLPLIDTTKYNIEGVANEIIRIIESNEYSSIQQICTKDLTHEYIFNHNIENILYKLLDDKYVNAFDHNKFMQNDGLMDNEIVTEVQRSINLKRKMICKWLINGTMTLTKNKILFSRDDDSFEIINNNYFKMITEGESKQVFQVLTTNEYLKNIVIIILKSTIYSHSKQATGHIENLGNIRARGTKIFLEMLWRNKLRHSYRSINDCGIIISEYVNTNPVEIVFKKYCEGTDKHSFYGMKNNKNVVLDNGEYISGPYVRYDWRNPNHITINNQTNVTENPYYYVMEEYFGKEEFFKLFLSNTNKVKPYGDKNVSIDILHKIINIDKSRETIIRLYCTIQSYLNQVGLEVKDGCFMLDNDGEMCWSEINQDCMRIINHNSNESLDKDIWRSGGSSSKDAIKDKWTTFNTIMTDYFSKNPFMNELKNYNHYHYEKIVNNILNDNRLLIPKEYRYIYEKLRSISHHKRVILTMDLYNNQPVLVKSGKVYESHSNGIIEEAFNKISLHPDILVVDLNGALNEDNNNRDIIKKLATKYYIHSGGGLRTIEDVQDVLKASARRIVVSSNTDTNFIQQIPKERLIVELSLNEDNYILINGRKTNTGIKFEDKIKELTKLNVEAISITFHHTEGHLNGIPKEQIREIMSNIPDTIKKVIIAGGVSSINDLEFLWTFKNVIPQLGSAIWKNNITMGQLYIAMAKFDSAGLLPAIIQDKYGLVKGLIYMNKESLEKSCNTRLLHRYSREHKRVMCKGESSGNYQNISKLSFDCDSDALLVTVDTENPFCHTNNFSCFSNQSVIKSNISTLNNYIKSHKNLNTYSGNMQRHSGLALSKIMEEFWELFCASDKYQVGECSDFLIHFIMYLNSQNISLDDILNELNARRWNPHLIKSLSSKQKNIEDIVVIGITSEKYYKKTDDFAKEQLGFEIIRPTGKNLKIDYNVVDVNKFKQYFGEKRISLIPIRPRDMNWMLALGTVDCVISYNSVIENNPQVYKKLVEVPDNSLKLVLIKRINDVIDPSTWSTTNKMIIATESVKFVHSYLTSLGINENYFTLNHVSGTSESFLVNDTKTNYNLCDAIVETGSTIRENNLETWKIVKDHGEITIGLYASLKF